MIKELESTAERVVPGKSDHIIFQEHTCRYIFASNYTKGKKVLDNACGTGYGAHYLLKSGGAKEVVGVDISEDAVCYAKNGYEGENISFVCADALNLPFLNEYFDVIVSFETIEHLQNHHRFLSECQRVLKKDGLLVCSTPNKKIYSPYSEKPLNPFHFREFYPEEFYELLSKYFTIIDLYGQNNVNLFKRMIFRIGTKTFSAVPYGNVFKKIIKNIISSNTNISANKKENLKDGGMAEVININYTVSVFKNNLLTAPTYIIAVAQKKER